MQELNSPEIGAKGKCSRGDPTQPYPDCHAFPRWVQGIAPGCPQLEHEAALGIQEGRTGAERVPVTSGT